MQVREKRLVLYWSSNKHNFIDNLKKNEKKTYSGTMTEGAKKRLIKAIELLLFISPNQIIYNPITNKSQNFRINFITLTFPITPSDNKIYYQCLVLFLQWLRDKKVKSYIWKAELTSKEKRLHYHITTNNFLNYKDIRNHWNKILKEANLLNEFYQKHHHWDANSTDIHAVIKINNLSKYLIKYIVKAIHDDENNIIHGKVWGCSRNLSSNKLWSTEINHQTWKKINTSNFIENYKNDYVEIFDYMNNNERDEQLTDEMFDNMRKFRTSL